MMIKEFCEKTLCFHLNFVVHFETSFSELVELIKQFACHAEGVVSITQLFTKCEAH